MHHAEVVNDILRGDVHRFSQIVHQFDEQIRVVIGYRVADPVVREELVQETFYRALKNLHQLSDPTRLEAWLAMIARHSVVDHFRKQKRRRRLETDQLSEPTHSSGEHRWVWDEVAQLNENFSTVLQLRYQLGLTYDEIAKQLNIPRSTVRGRIYEARLALRKRLEEGEILP